MMGKIGPLDLGNNDTLVAYSIQMQCTEIVKCSQNPQQAQSENENKCSVLPTAQLAIFEVK